MKNQILTFIIGLLIGGIITAGVFLIFKPNSNQGFGMNENMPSSMKEERQNFNGNGDNQNIILDDNNMTEGEK